MRRIIEVCFLLLILIIFKSCAKPEVIDVVLPGDEKLNCKDLKDAWQETRRFRKEAESVKDTGTGGNVTRIILFWPALVQTLHNAEVAMRAADDRAFHLINVMKTKKCKESDKLFFETAKEITPIYISQEIRRLNRQYKQGILTEEEFKKAKEKVLSK